MAIGTPRWIQSGERADAAAHPDGYPDVANRPQRDFYDTFGVEHSDDGTHKTSNEITYAEIIEYTGNGVDDRDISTNPVKPSLVFAFRADTNAPVLKIGTMGADETKELGVSAFQSNMIQIAATDSDYMQVGTDVAVNANGIDYVALAFGGTPEILGVYVGVSPGWTQVSDGETLNVAPGTLLHVTIFTGYHVTAFTPAAGTMDTPYNDGGTSWNIYWVGDETVLGAVSGLFEIYAGATKIFEFTLTRT